MWREIHSAPLKVQWAELTAMPQNEKASPLTVLDGHSAKQTGSPALSMGSFQSAWFSISGRPVIFRDQFTLKVAPGHMFSGGSWNPCSLRGSLLAGTHGLKCFLGLFWSREFKRAFHLHPKAQGWLLSAH